jgi:signal transduction histidine kinase
MPPTARPAPSIRRRLLQLVFACILPTTLLAAAIMVQDYRIKREQLFAGARATVRATALALEAEVSQPRLALGTLAQSRLLLASQWPQLHQQMRDVEPPLEVAGLFLVGRDGQLLLHTAADPGAALPALPSAVASAARGTAASTTGLLTDPVTGRMGTAIVVPLTSGAPALALGAWLPPERVAELLERQKFPHDWIVAVLDASGTLVARSHDMKLFMGRKGSSQLVERLAHQDEAVFESVTLEGIEVVTVFSKGGTALGWTVAAGLPRDAFVAELRQRALQLAAGAIVLLLCTLLLARWLGSRIVHSIQALRVPTAALGLGQPVVLPALSFQEAQELGRSLQEASHRQQADAAELRRSHDALLQSNLDLQQYAFIASHDMRGPLNTVSSYLDLLRRKHGDQLSPTGLGLVDRAASAVRHLDQLTQALLSYAKLGENARPFATVPMAEVLHETVQALESQLIAAQADVTHDDLPSVWGDRSLLTQLLHNLVGNAVKYRRDEPLRVHVSARREGDAWRIAVRDNGIGIEPRHQARIFEIFKRLHTQSEIPGTGIGLAICRRVVQAHGGTLGVESAPGQGSTFFFTVADKEKRP